MVMIEITVKLQHCYRWKFLQKIKNLQGEGMFVAAHGEGSVQSLHKLKKQTKAQKIQGEQKDLIMHLNKMDSYFECWNR